MNYYDEYKNKLRTPDEAVKVIKSGDWVDYRSHLAFLRCLMRLLRGAGMN